MLYLIIVGEYGSNVILKIEYLNEAINVENPNPTNPDRNS
jgi:hypothetical protein